MQTLAHSQLNDAQLAQVAYLFADAHFGNDARAFVYEVDRRGDVKGRTLAEGQPPAHSGRSKRNAPVNIQTTQEAHVTESMIFIFNAQMSMDALAASIAEKLFQHSQIEEVIK